MNAEINIAGVLKSVTTDNIISTTDQVYDNIQGKFQEDINQSTEEAINDAIGDVNEGINADLESIKNDIENIKTTIESIENITENIENITETVENIENITVTVSDLESTIEELETTIKSLSDYFYNGYNTVTTLTSVPITKRLVIASISTSQTLSFSGTIKQGLDIHIIIKNTSSNAITITLSDGNTFDIEGSSIGEVNAIYADDYYYRTT